MRDPEKARARSRRYRARKHVERFGEAAGDQRGRHGRHAKGSAHPRWNDRRIEASTGYVKVRVGTEHPLADPNGYAYEHLVVWCAAGKAPPGPGELLHHVNEDKTDNRIGNLEKKTRSDHGSEHIAERARDEHGRLLPRAAGRLLDGREYNEFPEVTCR
jgi:hypothetical protein